MLLGWVENERWVELGWFKKKILCSGLGVEKPCDLPWFGLGLSPLAGLLLDRGKDPFEVFAGWFTGIDGKAEVVQKTTMVLVFHPSIHSLAGRHRCRLGGETKHGGARARHDTHGVLVLVLILIAPSHHLPA
jgi:hypothetical protein